jgi:hypothetical protein
MQTLSSQASRDTPPLIGKRKERKEGGLLFENKAEFNQSNSVT